MQCGSYQPPRWLVWVLVIGLTGVPSSFLYAQTPSSEEERGMAPASHLGGASLLTKGIELYEEMEWERAAQQLQKALEQDLTAQEKAQAYWYLAVIAYAQDAREQAQGYLLELLRNQPDFQLPETLRGTDFEPLFKAALAQTDRTPPLIHIPPIPSVEAGKPLSVIAQISDTSSIARVELAYSTSEGTERSLPMNSGPNGQWTVEIPPDATKVPGEVTLRISATDAWRNTATESARAIITKGRGGGHALLYLVGGAIVAAGGGVAALLLGSSGGEEPGPPNNQPPEEGQWPQSKPPLPPQ